MQILKSLTFSPSAPTGQAVLLLHGWAGMPESVAPLGEAISDAGFLVFAPLLTGHGCDDPRDFLDATLEDWLSDAEKAYMALRDRYEVVHVAGISMGALLAMHLAQKFCCRSLILQAPAIENKNKAILLSPILRIFRYKKKRNPSAAPEASKGPVADKLDHDVYKAYTWFGPAYQLLRAQGLIKKYFREGTFRKGPGSGVWDVYVQWAMDDHSIDINAPLEVIKNITDNGLVGVAVFRIYPTGKHTLPLYSPTSTKDAVSFLTGLL